MLKNKLTLARIAELSKIHRNVLVKTAFVCLMTGACTNNLGLQMMKNENEKEEEKGGQIVPVNTEQVVPVHEDNNLNIASISSSSDKKGVAVINNQETTVGKLGEYSLMAHVDDMRNDAVVRKEEKKQYVNQMITNHENYKKVQDTTASVGTKIIAQSMDMDELITNSSKLNGQRREDFIEEVKVNNQASILNTNTNFVNASKDNEKMIKLMDRSDLVIEKMAGYFAKIHELHDKALEREEKEHDLNLKRIEKQKNQQLALREKELKQEEGRLEKELQLLDKRVKEELEREKLKNEQINAFKAKQAKLEAEKIEIMTIAKAQENQENERHAKVANENELQTSNEILRQKIEENKELIKIEESKAALVAKTKANDDIVMEYKEAVKIYERELEQMDYVIKGNSRSYSIKAIPPKIVEENGKRVVKSGEVSWYATN